VDDRTFVWRMKLAPETDYWLSINGTRFTNFRGKTGEAAEPYAVAFRTKAAGGAGAATRPAGEVAKGNKEAVARLRKAIDDEYSYRDLRKVDWEGRFAEWGPKLEGAASAAQFASAAARLLEAAQDIHLTLRIGEGQRIATWRRDVFPAVDLRVLEKTVPGWRKRAEFVFSGEYPDGVRYLCLTSLPADEGFVKAAYEVIGEAARAGKGLVIDVRPNGGGDEPTGRKIAGCFLEKPAVYAAHVIRSGGAFSEKSERVVGPNAEGPKFAGKVVVLTGPGTVSSCESFVLMMKQAPGCVTVGMTTAGSSGNPRTIDLGNGVGVNVPRWKALRADGSCLEGEGIKPDVEVKVGAGDLDGGRDGILEEGVKRVRG
jgi:hypothetical protein